MKHPAEWTAPLSSLAPPLAVGRERPRNAERVVSTARAVAISPALVWSIVVVAVALRTVRFLSDRSLWLDESYLTLNLMSRSYSDLVGTLDFNQGAPVGYLFLEKAVLQLLGDSEHVLRLPSFLAGVASVIVFVDVARRYLPRAAVPVAVFLFGVLEPFVYYSSETKQYGFDVLVTLVLLAVFARVVDRPLTLRSAAALAATGAVAVWFSHPAAFALAAYGAVAAITALIRRDARDLARQAFVYAAWLASFGVEYAISIRHLNQLRSSIIGDGGPGGGGHASSFTKSLVKNIYTIFSDPGQQPRTLVGVFAFAAAVGAFALARRSPARTALLIGTGVVALAAGALHRYPIGQRFILFLLPIAVLLVCAGLVALVATTRDELRVAVAVALGALVLLPATAMAVDHAVRQPDAEPMQPLLASISSGWRDRDVLYLYPPSQYAFRYYLSCHDCNDANSRERALWPFSAPNGQRQATQAVVSRSKALVVGSSNGDALGDLRSDLRPLRGKKRVWILLTHYFPLDLGTLTQELDAAGTRIATVRRGVGAAYLYDLSRPTP